MMRIFNKFIRVSLVVAVAVVFHSADLEAQNRNHSPNNAYSVDVFSARNGENLEVRTSGGSIQVIGTDAGEAIVEMYVRRGSRYLVAGDTDLSEYDIRIEKVGSTIIASAERVATRRTILSPNNNESISFVVSVPHNFNIDIRTSGGSISASDLDGLLNARTSGGSIRISSLQGDIDFRTSGGSITANDVHGNVSLRTSGGSVRVEDASGSIVARTSGGSMRFANINGELDGQTSGGSIVANIDDLFGDLNLRTSGGSIRASLPSDLKADVDIRGSRVSMPLRNFNGSSSRNSISGSMNGGGNSLVLRTSGGSVTVTFN